MEGNTYNLSALIYKGGTDKVEGRGRDPESWSHPAGQERPAFPARTAAQAT